MPDGLSVLDIATVVQPFCQTKSSLAAGTRKIVGLILTGAARTLSDTDNAGCTAAAPDTAYRDCAKRRLAQASVLTEPGGASDGRGIGTGSAGTVCTGDVHGCIRPGGGEAPVEVPGSNASFAGIRERLEWVRDCTNDHAMTAVCTSLHTGLKRKKVTCLDGVVLSALIDGLAHALLTCARTIALDFKTGKTMDLVV